MVYCCCGCKERYVRNGTLTFHAFPTDPVKRRLWEIRICRKDFKATKYTKICSKHFTPDCFDRNKLGGTWLKRTAIPTVFDFPDPFQKAITLRNSPTKHNLVEVISQYSQEEDSKVTFQKNCVIKRELDAVISKNLHEEDGKMTFQRNSPTKRELAEVISENSQEEDDSSVGCPKKQKRLYYLGDFNEKDVTSPSNAKKLLQIAQAQLFKCKQKIKQLRRVNQQLEMRVCFVTDKLIEMQNKITPDDSSMDLKKLYRICHPAQSVTKKKELSELLGEKKVK